MRKLQSLFASKTSKVLLLACIGIFGISSNVNDTRYFEIAKNIEIFTNIYKEINTYYVDEVDPAKLMRTGIDAMLESLDPYTNYISESEIEDFRFMTTGKYGGIGALIRKSGDYVVITEPYEGFPADEAGMKAGDKIIAIEGKSAKGKKSGEVSNILKGSPGTEVSLTIERPGTEKPFDVSVKRAEVNVPNVPYSGMVNDEVGYVILTTFTQNAGKNVGNAVKKLKKDNPDMKGVILDLRGNGGGLLREAVNVSNVFIDKGLEVVTTKSKIKDWDMSQKTLNAPIDKDIQLAVLIDKNSASASEIVSGVIQDYDRGVLIGQKSYGKGLVQNTKEVGYNSKVKMTISKYYIPSGRCIQSVNYKNGEPVVLNDSLRTAFETKNGRTVYDGGGVLPDFTLGNEKYSNITIALLSKSLIFDYATEYCLKNESIDDSKSFNLGDADFKNFKAFLKTRSFDFEAKSEKAITSLLKEAEKDGVDQLIEADLDAIKAKIHAAKEMDLEKNKDQILRLLEKEIVGRYFYRKGIIENGLQNDPEIEKAIEIFNDTDVYKKTLGE